MALSGLAGIRPAIYRGINYFDAFSTTLFGRAGRYHKAQWMAKIEG
jgi:hypothetical protein